MTAEEYKAGYFVSY